MRKIMNTKIKCPVCGKESKWEGNPFRPFCSERCSLIDLGKWSEGKYSIEAEEGKGQGEMEKGDEPG